MNKKEKVYSDNQYPLNNLDDRKFEELIYSLFRARIAGNDVKGEFDSIELMPGVAEQGKDCTLYKDNKIKGIVQCKRYKSNLSDKLIIKEFLKFSIHRYLDSNKFANDVIYYFATTTGYTQKAIDVVQQINSGNIMSICDFENIIKSLIKETKLFSLLQYDNIKNDLISIIQKIKISQYIKPIDIFIWLNKYNDISSQFFDMKTIIISQQSSNEESETAKFKDDYYKIAKTKFDEVNFIGLDLKKGRSTPTDIGLEDIYVNPLFKKLEVRKTDNFGNNGKTLNYSDIFTTEKNIVVLGEPGAGKSLLVKDIILRVINDNLSSVKLRKMKNNIPFRIELRKYNEVRERKSVIEYFSDVFKVEFQINISTEILTYIFSKKETIVFFDGFDEIFDKKHKEIIKGLIDAFSTKYQKCKCIVTSRFIGYHEVRFNNKLYDEFSIQHFNSNQIEELVTKFYKTQYKAIERQKKHTKDSIEQIEKNVDNDLKQNPLILTLILILINNNIAIPDSKLEIYESCTKTLVDTIDAKEKELKFEMPVKNKRAVLDFLGYWQYEQTTKNQPVEYEKAIQALSDYLLHKKEVSDYTEAESKAEKFLEYAEKRSIYFENNFTHKTFLEYFTADYLFINHITKASDDAKTKLQGIIRQYLPNPYWYIVFELLFSIIDNSQSDNELLDEIITEQIKTSNIDVLYFFVSHIFRTNNVSDNTIHDILKKAIVSCIDGKKITSRVKNSKNSLEENCIVRKISNLQKYPRIAPILQSVITEIEKSLTDEQKQINFYNLYYEIDSVTPREVKIRLIITNQELCAELSKKDKLLCSNEFVKKDDYIETSKLIEYQNLFSRESIFDTIDLKYRTNVYRVDLFSIYLWRVFEFSTIRQFEKDLDSLIPSYYSIDDLLNGIKKSTSMFYFRKEVGMSKLFDFYKISKNKHIDMIIIALIQVDEATRQMYKNYLEKQDLKKHLKLKDLNNMFKI